MKKILLITMLIATLCLVGCQKNYTTFELYFKSFITAYFEYHNVDIVVKDGYNILVEPKFGEIFYESSEDPQHKARFDELAQHYNDLNYNKKHISASPFAAPNLMPVENITEIEIVCLEDINEQYVAGSSVADFFTFRAVSPLRFIETGYKYSGEMGYYTNSFFYQYYEPRNKPLVAVCTNDLTLIGNGEILHYKLFILTPTSSNSLLLCGKKLRLTLKYDNQYPISKEFTLTAGRY